MKTRQISNNNSLTQRLQRFASMRIRQAATNTFNHIDEGLRAIRPSERVVVFETTAHLDMNRRRWVIPVHAWVYAENRDSGWRNQAIARLFEKRHPRTDAESRLRYKGRIWPFIVNNRTGREVKVSLKTGQGTIRTVGRTGSNGHVEGLLELPAKMVKRSGWMDIAVKLADSDSRKIRGRVQLIPPEGTSVISDIDDTIKVSRILQKSELFTNTFVEPYLTVDGMAQKYRQWAEQGAIFHYVSGTPWQLYPALQPFLEDAGFPAGSFHLRTVHFWDSRLLNLFADAHTYKKPPIRELLLRYPLRKFVLIGDLGEYDAEIYSELAQEFPEQISSIWLRRPDEVKQSAAKLRSQLTELFSGLPNLQWGIFENGSDLPANLPVELTIALPG